MSLIFTEQLDKPSELRSKPSNLLRPIFGALYGFDSTAIATNTFTTLTVADTDTNAIGASDTITFTVQPSVAIASGGTLTLTGMQGTQTANNASLTVGGAGAAIFGSSGSWTQSTGTLVLTVAGGQSLPTGSDTVITFDLTNASSVQSGKTVSVSSNTFITANATGTVLDTIAIFNVTTRNTEANILASTPTNPTDEVNIAFGTDTGDFYIYNGSAWYIYNDTPFNSYSVSFDGSDDYLSLSSVVTSSAQQGTISAWIKTNTTGAYMPIFTVSNNTSGVTNEWITLQVDNTGKFEIISNRLGTVEVFESSSTVNDNAWHHIMVTSDGSSYKLFKNGAEQTSASGNNTGTWIGDIGTKNTSSIGAMRRSSDTSNSYFNGNIDELAVWDSDQSSNISTIYNNGVPNDLSSLNPLGYWRMGDNDNGTGTTITDQGSGGNNGTLTNGATFSTTVPS
mgnify:CR=1 FL=1